MRPVMPSVEVPGDNAKSFNLWHATNLTVRANIMARSGDLRGFDRRHAVWCFGFLAESEAANAYGVAICESATLYGEHGFLWVLATLRTGKVKRTYRGYSADLPPSFTRVLEAKL